MERILIRVVITTSVCILSAKHVYITSPRTWISAQQYCRTYFTDLSPITNELEDEVFRESVDQASSGWIGLSRDSNSPTGWTWSGGEHMTYTDFSYTYSFSWYYPYVYWTPNGWQYGRNYDDKKFFCLNLIMVEVKMSWEKALEHCRENHTDFTSLLSKTEVLLAMSEIQQDHITERVWIGLRYLDDSWLWVDGNPLVYEAWSQGGDQDHQCPTRKRCAALTKQGLWENWDCSDQLNFICI